jgi:outer membrane protein, adhesin transport system
MRSRCAGLGRAGLALLLSGAAVLPAQTYGPTSPAQVAGPPPGTVPPAIPAELASAASRAVDSNPATRAARLSVRAAETDVKSARWLYGPSVSVQAFAFEGGSAVVRGDNLTANLVVDQPIWQGGRIGGTVDRARAAQRQTEAFTDETADEIGLRVTNTYFELVRALERVRALEQGLSEHRNLVGSIERRVTQEVSPRVDLELARSRTAQLIESQTSAQAQASANLEQLRVLLADPSFTPNANPTYDPAVHHPSQDGAMEAAISCSPTRRRLQAEALVARADQRLARAAVLPRLSAQFTSNEVTGERVGLALNATTNGGLSQFEAERAARLRRDAAEVRIGAADLELQTALAADFAENSAARDRIASSRAAARSARAVTDSFQRQFVVGRRSWLDVMNTALEVTQSEVAAADAEVSAMASAARILLRTCRWQPQPRVSRP